MSIASSSTPQSPDSDPKSEYLTKEQLRDRLNLASTRKIDEMVKARMIPVMKLGHKTVRFRWSKVQEALNRFECKAVQ